MPFNATQGIGGGLTGAATGASIGSVVPGIGTAIGAGIGGLLGLFSGISRNPEKKKQKALRAQAAKDRAAQRYFQQHGEYPQGYVPSSGAGGTPTNPAPGLPEGSGFQYAPNKYSPEQQAVLNYLLTQGKGRLENPYAGFEPIEQEARSKFQSETIPSIAERFSALGGSDTRYLSDFAGTLGGAASEFDQGIAALRAQYGMQNQDKALELLRMGLIPQNELVYLPQTPDAPSAGSQILSQGLTDVGDYIRHGGDFGIGKVIADRKAKQEQASLVNQLINRDRLGALAMQRSSAQNPRIDTFAKLLALKRLQKGR